MSGGDRSSVRGVGGREMVGGLDWAIEGLAGMLPAGAEAEIGLSGISRPAITTEARRADEISESAREQSNVMLGRAADGSAAPPFFRIYHDDEDQQLVVDFGQAFAGRVWLTPADAVALSQALDRHAKEYPEVRGPMLARPVHVERIGEGGKIFDLRLPGGGGVCLTREAVEALLADLVEALDFRRSRGVLAVAGKRLARTEASGAPADAGSGAWQRSVVGAPGAGIEAERSRQRLEEPHFGMDLCADCRRTMCNGCVI